MISPISVLGLDHLVLTVRDVERTLSFYRRVLGMVPVTFGNGRRALSFGNQKINLHPVGEEIDPHASAPAPGSADLCFLVDLSIDALLSHLAFLGISHELGPVHRTGAMGTLISVYIRDPDGNMIELSRPVTSAAEIPENFFLFKSDRLLFRNFSSTDTDAVHRYASDPLVTRMTYWGPYSLAESESFIRRGIRNAAGNPRSFYDLAIVSKEKGPLSFPIGGCKIHVTDRENREGEIGYYLEQTSWNQGFATETARSLLSFGFSRLGLHRMVALCFVENRGSAHVLFRYLGYPGNALVFNTRSGDLVVEEKDGLIVMDFPALRSKPCSPPGELVEGLGKVPVEVWTGMAYIAVYESADDIRSLEPDDALLRSLDLKGVAVTAPGRKLEQDIDFVSRYFAPKVGVSEDPVTGSAHCSLAPYWAERLGKNEMKARQLSKRGGTVFCEVRGDRVFLSGRAVTFLEGEIDLPAHGPLFEQPSLRSPCLKVNSR